MKLEKFLDFSCEDKVDIYLLFRLFK